ncbi:MAG TPA: carbohydrate binding domain-containing protein [Pyrinomonadaceae bacterium]|nr:carbohydrate binding domain-containing protein [Pyrinomonadaceae bacterium]
MVGWATFVKGAADSPPITNAQPPSTLLPPGTTALSLTVQSSENTTCAFGMGVALPYDDMTPFDQGAGTTVHQTTLRNLDPDPNVVNNVYVRCASHPDYVLQLKYRSLSQANPSYPRTGNLWGWWDLFGKGLPDMARIDLWLGAAHATAGEIRELRLLNPDIRILTNINAVDNANLPDDYYLKDIYGNRREVWPNSFRLNLTKPYVAEYQARYAYQRMLDKDLMFDGVFFDNVFTTQSWRKYDIHGNRFLVDADENGVEDDPDAFDAAWKAGVFHELETFRALMPHAVMSGHAMDITEPGIAEIFNGISIGFRTADVLEGEMIFADLWDDYHAWHAMARQPHVTMIESSPPDQIAYGYDYSPWNKIPPSTLEFARTYYPYVRFGLALTLMNDGYFAHEFGDTWHGNDWWYDELNFELGYPLGPAERVDLGLPPGEDQIVNGGFEAAISDPWRFLVNEIEGNSATLSRDTTDKAVGAASARIDVTAASGVERHIRLAQYDRSLEQGVIYDVSFWAKSDTQRTITLSAQKGSPDWRGYGLWRHVPIDTGWKQYRISFAANESADDARIQFLVGETSGTVWLDDVSMVVRSPDVYQRKFTNGMVLLNGSQEPHEITIGPGYRRVQGQQAPRYEMILDDGEAAFSTSGAWTSVKYDSGELQATGPFYHCWKETCRERSGSQGEARWDLEIQAADTYTITAWWPAAPQANTWNQNVTYEVVVGEQVVASETFDQRSGGDEWHFVAEVPLSPDKINVVRMHCQGEAPCLADALHLRSQARYNDGSSVVKVTLQPLDGIVLARLKGPDVYLPLILKSWSVATAISGDWSAGFSLRRAQMWQPDPTPLRCRGR